MLAAVRLERSVYSVTKKRKAIAWLMIIPALALNIFVVGGPVVGTLLMSLTNWDGIRPAKFIGIANFQKLMADTSFFGAVVNNLKWTLFFVTVPIIFALIMAMILSRVKRGQMLYRVLFFVPYIIMSVVIAKMWSLIFNPFSGIATILAKIGIEAPLFLGDPDIALYSVAVVDASRYWIFLMIMFLTAFFQLDKSLEEAATIDGANRVQNFLYVVIPQIRPTLVTIISLTFIWSFGAFDFVYLMTAGGPGNATELISTYMYRLAMSGRQPGYASAISLVMTLFSMGLLGIMALLRKRGWDI